jgi:hypothetical protein
MKTILLPLDGSVVAEQVILSVRDWHYERRAQTQLGLLLFEGRWLYPFYLRNGQGKPWDECLPDPG